MRTVARFLVILRGDEKASLSSVLMKADLCAYMKSAGASHDREDGIPEGSLPVSLLALEDLELDRLCCNLLPQELRLLELLLE